MAAGSQLCRGMTAALTPTPHRNKRNKTITVEGEREALPNRPPAWKSRVPVILYVQAVAAISRTPAVRV